MMSILRRISTILAAAAIVTAMIACSLPFSTYPPAPTPPEAIQTNESSLPPLVLTQVASTLYAPLSATLTQQAVMLPAVTLQAAPPMTAAPTRTQAPTAVQTESPPSTQISASSPTAQITLSAPSPSAPTVFTVPNLPPPAATQSAPAIPAQPTAYFPSFPPSGYRAQSGSAFTIAGVNLPVCAANFGANFLIHNHSGYTFESMSLQITDLNTGFDVYGPVISDTPFKFTDENCVSGGVARLENGRGLFVGGALNSPGLSGHTLQANFLLCTGNSLSGRCYPRTVEFVVP
jgi:hypothetical protein